MQQHMREEERGLHLCPPLPNPLPHFLLLLLSNQPTLKQLLLLHLTACWNALVTA
jgi:hypothetical protein